MTVEQLEEEIDKLKYFISVLKEENKELKLENIQLTEDVSRLIYDIQYEANTYGW